MAITASQITSSQTLEEFRLEFNKLHEDVSILGTSNAPSSADGAALGSASKEWSDLYLADGGVIYFGNDQDITLTHTPDTGLTTNGTFQATTITATTAVVPDASDGAALGTTTLEWSDLYLADGAVIGFGDDQDVTLTHVADTGIRLADGDQMQLGTGGDLKVYHSGTYGYITNATGTMHLGSDALNLTNQAVNASYITMVNGAAVSLYYNNTIALATASAAVNVTGDLTATLTIQPQGGTAAGDTAAIGYTSGEGLKLTGQGSSYDVTLLNDAAGTVFGVPTGETSILFPDDAKAEFGTGRDLKISHNGTNTSITNITGQLRIGGNDIRIQTQNHSEDHILCVDGGAVTLHYNDSAKLATSTDGGTLTGTWEATTALVPDASDGAALGTNALEWSDLYLADAAVIYFGADQDVSLTHGHNVGLTLAGQFINSTAVGPAIQVTQSTAGENALRAIGSHASFTGNVLQPWTVRAAGTAFDLIECVTNNGSEVPFRVRGDGQVTSIAGAAFAGAVTVGAEGGSATTSVSLGLCKAWVRTSGTAVTVSDSFNMSSVTDSGVGVYAPVINNNMNDGAYAVISSADDKQDGAGIFVHNVNDAVAQATTGYGTTFKKLSVSAYSATDANQNAASSVLGDLA